MSLIVYSAVIPNGTALSSVIDVTGVQVLGLNMPATWTAATITLDASTTSTGTFNSVVTRGATEYSITATAAKYHLLGGIDTTPDILKGVMFIKLRSGTFATPVNQAAERTIELVCRQYGPGVS